MWGLLWNKAFIGREIIMIGSQLPLGATMFKLRTAEIQGDSCAIYARITKKKDPWKPG